MATIDKRLAHLEATRRAPVTVCCVRIGDGPALRPGGVVCTAHHDHVYVIGGEVRPHDHKGD